MNKESKDEQIGLAYDRMFNAFEKYWSKLPIEVIQRIEEYNDAVKS